MLLERTEALLKGAKHRDGAIGVMSGLSKFVEDLLLPCNTGLKLRDVPLSLGKVLLIHAHSLAQCEEARTRLAILPHAGHMRQVGRPPIALLHFGARPCHGPVAGSPPNAHAIDLTCRSKPECEFSTLQDGLQFDCQRRARLQLARSPRPTDRCLRASRRLEVVLVLGRLAQCTHDVFPGDHPY
jgi:hypothetical protein